jgi:hypothetical protein
MIRACVFALAATSLSGDAARAQIGGGREISGLDGLGRWDAAARRSSIDRRTNRPPRRWTLYFPPDWRHPAIIRPPIKVFLDPPYGWEDPFGRIPNSPPEETTPAPPPPPPPAQPVVTRPAIPKPKVLELNPETGRLEPRELGPAEPAPESSLEELPRPTPRRTSTKPSPFRDLQRWDDPAE